MIKLGVIGCVHGKITPLRKIIKKFAKEKIDAIVLTGDINSPNKPRQSIVKIIRILLQLKKPIFVIPGSHEPVKAYKEALRRFRGNKLVFDCTLKRNRTRKINSYELVFLPGSDWSAPGAGFRLLTNRRALSKFEKRRKQLLEFFFGPMKFFFINSLKKFVKCPERTILISHIPPRFYKKTAIDVAKFGKPLRTFKIKFKHTKRKFFKEKIGVQIIEAKHAVYSTDVARWLQKLGYPIKIVKENVGNKELRKWIKKLRIDKMVCSHIHEAGQRGCDLKGNLIEQERWSKELFYNPGSAGEGKAGIYIIEEDKAKYKNIKIKI